MKALFLVNLIVFLMISCTSHQDEYTGFRLVETSKIPDSLMIKTDSADLDFNFHMTYCVAGMGSNHGKKMQYFEVIDSLFVFTLKQNSYSGEPTLKPDTIQTGLFRSSSRDSILTLIEHLPDTAISKKNLEGKNEALISVVMQTKIKRVSISMLNCSDEIAAQIIEILNTYVILEDKKLYLINAPAIDYGF